jgi:hypothetical protein
MIYKKIGKSKIIYLYEFIQSATIFILYAFFCCIVKNNVILLNIRIKVFYDKMDNYVRI